MNLIDRIEHKPAPAATAPGEPDAAGEAPKAVKSDAHRQMVIVLSSVAAVVIAWFTYRKLSAGASSTATPTSSASVPSVGSGAVAGTPPSGDVSNSAVSGFEAMLENMQAQVTQLTDVSAAGNGAGTALPIASTLFAPSTDSGLSYVQSGGVGYQVESDGSLFGETLQQWIAQGQPAFTQIGALPTGTVSYSTQGNLGTKNAPPAAAAATVAAT